jgi:hypothetical protein
VRRASVNWPQQGQHHRWFDPNLTWCSCWIGACLSGTSRFVWAQCLPARVTTTARPPPTGQFVYRSACKLGEDVLLNHVDLMRWKCGNLEQYQKNKNCDFSTTFGGTGLLGGEKSAPWMYAVATKFQPG